MQEKVSKLKDQIKEVETTYYSTCSYFMIGPNDDRRKKLTAPRADNKTPSQLFFQFFIDFIDKVEEQLKKKDKPLKKTASGMQKTVGMGMMGMLAVPKK